MVDGNRVDKTRYTWPVNALKVFIITHIDSGPAAQWQNLFIPVNNHSAVTYPTAIGKHVDGDQLCSSIRADVNVVLLGNCDCDSTYQSSPRM